MCLCAHLPAAIYVDRQPSEFVSSLEQIAVGDWVELCRCTSCQQLWRVDEWDKYQNQVAVKVPSQEGWQSFNAKPLELELLAKSRGGFSGERCVWAGCAGHAVKGVAYCVEHLYETGARR